MSKIYVKRNLRIITKNHPADPEIGFLTNRFQSRMAAQRPCRQRGSLFDFSEEFAPFLEPAAMAN